MALSAQRRDRYRRIAARARKIPGEHGLRPYAVAIVVGTWAGTYVGRGGQVATLEPITEQGGYPPKVRFLNEEQRVLAGLATGSCTIGPITPDFATGGTALTELLPAVVAQQTVHVKLTGPAYPSGALFTVKEIKTDRALHWTLVCEPTQQGQ